MIYKIDFKSQVTEVATAGSNLHRKYFFSLQNLHHRKKLLFFNSSFFSSIFLSTFVQFKIHLTPRRARDAAHRRHCRRRRCRCRHRRRRCSRSAKSKN